MAKQNMSVQAIWNIRDARGLTTYEKTFLFIVASRGKAKTYRKTMMNDMNCSTGQLTNIVRSLKEKDLITVHEGFWQDGKKTQTMYTVNEAVLASFVPERSPHELGSSPHEQGGSPDERGGSPHGVYKETEKVTKKETVKENTKDSASATSYELKECKEQGEVTENVDQSSLASSKNTPGPSLEVVKEDAPNDLEGKGAAATEYDEWALDLIRKSEYAEEALKLFLDPTWEEKLDPLRRANLAVIRVTPVREPAQAKEAATETIEWDW